VNLFQLLFYQMGRGRQDKKGNAAREPKPNLAIVCGIKPKQQTVFIGDITAVKLFNAHGVYLSAWFIKAPIPLRKQSE
jgi:hypothetical protein